MRSNRRTLLKGAAVAAAAVAASGARPSPRRPSSSRPGRRSTSPTGARGRVTSARPSRKSSSASTSRRATSSVDYQFQGSYEETAQKLTAALAAKQTPDVSALSDVWWFKFYINQVLAPLNDFIAANEVDTSDYVDSLWNEGVRNDQQYWIPFARSTPLFYYNKDAFKEIGLDEPPAKWSEFAEIAPQLVKKDGDTVTRSAFAHATGAGIRRLDLPGGRLGLRRLLLRPRFHHSHQRAEISRCRRVLPEVGSGRLGDYQSGPGQWSG